jgi:isopentenyl-diphosphate delta-isomerase type 1
MSEEQVVLVNEHSGPIGVMAKSLAHSQTTPLHLGFSVYIFGDEGKVLMTRRALTKATWPGVWTNSCCGHPGVNEPIKAAVQRRIREELRLEVDALSDLLPFFSYCAHDVSGVWENEICPVFEAHTIGRSEVIMNPVEVMDFAWVDWPSMEKAMIATPFAFSPWAVKQVTSLASRIP